MEKNLQLIEAVINNLDLLVVQGVRNMNIVVESTKILDALRKNLTAEVPEKKEEKDAQTKAK